MRDMLHYAWLAENVVRERPERQTGGDGVMSDD